jgi:hypothetical protein
MNLYLISRPGPYSYDEYEGAVVAAESEEAARRIHPNGAPWDEAERIWSSSYGGGWTYPENVSAHFLGVAANGTEAGVILDKYTGT